MTKVKALNRDGKITWCTAKNPGTGTCNHIFHKTKNTTNEKFQQKVDEYNEKMAKLLNSNLWTDRKECADAGYGLNTLMDDENYQVRLSVAEQGYGLEKLAHDENKFVRRAVAEVTDKYDDILVKDEDFMVRAAIAKRGRCQDKLINDEHWVVREHVAKNGYGHDILVKDSDTFVRMEVARQGSYSDILMNDEDELVREIALEKYNEGRLKQLYEGTMKKQDIYKCINDRIGLDIIARNKDKYIRGEVAAKGECTDLLVKDDEPYVRSMVALAQHHHYILSRDKDESVRAAVASCCNKEILSKLATDSSPLVRQKVAYRGNLLSKEEFDKLLNDENFYVREAAKLAGRE